MSYTPKHYSYLISSIHHKTYIYNNGMISDAIDGIVNIKVVYTT